MLRSTPLRVWALVGLVVLVALLLAVRAPFIVVGAPAGGVWGTVDQWASLGAVWEGLGTLVLALGALIGAGWAIYRHFEQRDRELRLRERQNDLDVARLQADLVTELRLRYEQARGQLEHLALRRELQVEEDNYLAILRGLVLLRPELAQAQREAIRSYLFDLAQV